MFEGPDTIGEVLTGWRRKALAEVAALSHEALRSHDPDELEAAILERYRVEHLYVAWDKWTYEPREIEIPGRTQPGEVTGTRVNLFVPFTGPPGLFHLRPSTHHEVPPHGTVRGGDSLLLNYSYVDADSSTVKRQLDHQVAVIKERVSSINSYVDAYNADLPGLIHAALMARLDKLRTAEDVVAALGVPLRQRATVARDEVRPARTRTPSSSDRAQPVRTPTEQRSQPDRRPAGRPTGSGWLFADRAELLDRYQHVRRQMGRRPTQREFAQATDMGHRTVRT